MKALGVNEIREKYLSFFESKGHLRLKSYSLVPINDKSLLLINSGMAPMKAFFTGDEVPPRKRVTTCQKCIRTPDIDNVGKTARHGTFFEMLGNFSFGDYFKKEVIPWAWEFCTEVMELDPEKLYVTVYHDDDEAYNLWHDVVGVSEDHISRLGKEDNFWEHGTGPCGPCSEIFYDRGEEYGCGKPDCAPGCDCDRYEEFWNLVFTQFDRDENDNYTPLDHPNIDTGMGLERLATIMQGVDNLFEVDTVRHILDYVCSLAHVEYGKDHDTDVSIRVITDHVRSITFMIADGVMPSNEGRGYVLRRLLRRAARHGRNLGIEGDFLYDVAKEVAKVSGDAYPELNTKLEFIQKLIKIEEERFKETVEQGLQLVKEALEDNPKVKETKVFPGKAAFKLYDTFGFPIELTEEIVGERGFKVDRDAFYAEMEAQRTRARKALEEKDTEVWTDDPFNPLGKDAVNTFVGYDTLSAEGKILGFVSGEALADTVHEGENVLILLDQTPFYAESGGQVGDVGRIFTDDAEIEVTDCKKGSLGRHIHYGQVTKGSMKVGETVTAEVAPMVRKATMRNHTATHLLQKALKLVLGDHVEQAGSYVSPTRLRFDFNHFKAMTPEEIKQVEVIVNGAIMAASDVTIFETNIDEAKKLGAMALFGEKYGEIVRVVKVGDFSIELCGGTHLSNSSEAGLFKIISETGVAAGIRRIEATTGLNTLTYVEKMNDLLKAASAELKTSPDHLVERVEELKTASREKDKTIEKMKQAMQKDAAESIIEKMITIGGIKAVIANVDGANADELRKISDQLKDKMESGIVVLGTKSADKATFIATATKDITKKGFHAGKLIKNVAQIAGGGGGGRPDMAQAGGKKPEKIQDALDAAEDFIKEQLG